MIATTMVEELEAERKQSRGNSVRRAPSVRPKESGCVQLARKGLPRLRFERGEELEPESFGVVGFRISEMDEVGVWW